MGSIPYFCSAVFIATFTPCDSSELLSKFEEGSKLLAQCEQRLKSAEIKIEQLKRQRDGSVALEPFPHERSAD